MPVQKIKSGRVTDRTADEFVGSHGQIFYNEELGDLRLSDGVTLGGLPIGGTGGGTHITVTQNNTTITPTSINFTGAGLTTTVTGNSVTINVTGIAKILDGGNPFTVYT